MQQSEILDAARELMNEVETKRCANAEITIRWNPVQRSWSVGAIVEEVS